MQKETKGFWRAIRRRGSQVTELMEMMSLKKTTAVKENKEKILRGSLPVLQVWPSQDSPATSTATNEELDQQSVLFLSSPEAYSDNEEYFVMSSNNFGVAHDSGIESVKQVSPSPVEHYSPSCSLTTSASSNSIRAGTQKPRQKRRHRVSSIGLLLHPDDARNLDPSCCSSSTSSINVVAQTIDRDDGSLSTSCAENRRRCSLLDALDLEYALMRAAARGSVGPYSLSESIHKLTFTQTLAFPSLARKLANKKRQGGPTDSSMLSKKRPTSSTATESGLNALSKVTTTLVLVLVSVLVFGVVYKFVRT